MKWIFGRPDADKASQAEYPFHELLNFTNGKMYVDTGGLSDVDDDEAKN